jgi:hypothetical protein
VVTVDLGEVYSPDMVAEVAERLSFLEGMKWSLAMGTFRGQLYVSLRVRDRRMNAGKLIRDICEDRGGSAGGHGSMAGARLPFPPGRAPAALRRELTSAFLEAFGVKGAAAVAPARREERRHRAVTYLDHNAGTPLFPEVAEFLAAAFRREPAGNPSSVHGAGRAARARLDGARARVGRVLGRAGRDVLFTASGSEACATAVLGLGRGGTLLTSAIEHPCVLLAAERRGTPVVHLRPGADGRVPAEAFDARLGSAGVALCALQAATNETGVVQPADEVAALARARGVVSFVDAVQARGGCRRGSRRTWWRTRRTSSAARRG